MRRIGVLAAALVLTVAVSPAEGARTVRPTTGLLGGGRVANGYTPYAQFVRLQASRNRRSVTFQADFLQTCAGYSGNPLYSPRNVYTVKLRRNGTFSGGGAFHSTRLGTADGIVSFSGRYTNGTAAVGTARQQFTLQLPDGRKFNCDSGTFKWSVRAPHSVPSGGRPAGGGAYYGTTQQRFPFAARIARDRSSVRLLAFEWSAQCSFGGVASSDAEIEFFAIHRGRVHGQAKLVAHPDAQTTDTIQYTASLRVAAHKVSGQLQVDVERTRGGQPVGSCKSGAIRVRAIG